MVSRPRSPTVANEMEAIQPTENNIEEPQLLRLKLSRRSHKGYMRRLLNQALELLQNEDTTLEALTKFKQQITSEKVDLSKENHEIEALTSLEKLEEESEETISFTEEIDNCFFELDKMVKKNFQKLKTNQHSKEETPTETAPSSKQIQDSQS